MQMDTTCNPLPDNSSVTRNLTDTQASVTDHGRPLWRATTLAGRSIVLRPHTKTSLALLSSLPAALIPCAGTTPQSVEMALTRPNIVLILCDDLGADDLGIAGNLHGRTPNIDALARASVRFADFTVNPVCAPSRASLLTGRHFLRTGVAHVHGGKDFVHRNEVLLPQYLRDAGYATGMWGKWHNGTAEGYFPWQRGFDEVYMADLYRHRATSGTWQDGSRSTSAEWADKFIVDHAIKFIRRHRDGPFFAFLPTLTPHGPHDAPADLVDAYKSRGLAEGPARLFAMIEFFDLQIGRLLKVLEEEHLEDNTVVVFLSDNGPNHDGHFSPIERELRRVRGLRGWKGDIWEGGVRSPLFIRWPGKIASREVSMPVQMCDLFPTLLEFVGIGDKTDGSKPIDGLSLLNLLTRRDPEPIPERPIFNYANPGWPPAADRPYSPMGMRDEYRPIAPEDKPLLDAETQVISLRQGDFKLLLNAELNTNWVDQPRGDYQLIHLPSDPTENHDVQAKHPQVFQEMRRDLLGWFDRMRAEPHSFSAPSWSVTAQHEAIVIATGALRIAPGMRNTVTHLEGWRVADAYADYELEIETAGIYRIEATGEEISPSEFAAVVRGENYGRNPVPASGIYLPAGKIEIRVRMANPPAGSDPKLRFLRLVRLPASNTAQQ